MDAYGAYQDVNIDAQVSHASPVELVLILLDHLEDELARVKGHIEHKRFEAKSKSISKCLDILNGLNSALDMDSGNEVVVNLARLYDYCAHRINQAGIEMDPSAIDEVNTLLSTLKDGWLGVKAKNGA